MHGQVVILVISHKSILEETEINSLRQLYKILGHYPIKFICPEGLDISSYEIISNKIEFDFIEAEWLSNYLMFNRFKLLPQLYYKYNKYRYILFYQLDAWVFRDELAEWCNKNLIILAPPGLINGIML